MTRARVTDAYTTAKFENVVKAHKTAGEIERGYKLESPALYKQRMTVAALAVKKMIDDMGANFHAFFLQEANTGSREVTPAVAPAGGAAGTPVKVEDKHEHNFFRRELERLVCDPTGAGADGKKNLRYRQNGIPPSMVYP